MKKYFLFPVLASLFLSSCGEDYADKTVSETDSDFSQVNVENAVATPFVGSVILTWDLPANKDYYYTLIDYTNSEGKQVRRKVSKYSVDPDDPAKIRALIGGFTDTEEHTFVLTHYSFSDVASSSVTMTGTPEPRSRAKDYLVQGVTFEPVVEGFNIKWENELDAKVKLVVEYLNLGDQRKTVEFDATLPRVVTIDEIPVETDIELNYYMVDLETEEKSETLTQTKQVLPHPLDVFDPSMIYIPNSFYGINMCTVEWNETKNYYVVKTTGTDPYIYTQLPGTPTGDKLVFRYKTAKNINSIEIFLNGRAPAPANSTSGTSDLNVYNYSTGKYYKGLPLTKYWRTVVWDLSKARTTKYDFIKLSGSEAGMNKNKMRFDFGGQNTRELHIRGMHWE